jgi:transposase
VSERYDGRGMVGLDLHRHRTVMVRMTPAGERLEVARFASDAAVLRDQIAKAGPAPEVVLEATYGWYWAADALATAGAAVHLAHPLGVKAFAYRRVKNDVRDATDLADLLRMGRLPEAWISPPEVRARRELVRHRHKLVQGATWIKAQVHAVLAKCGQGPRVIRVSVPAKVLNDLDSIQRVQADVLGQLGCQACCSGFDIRFDLARQFLVDEQLNVRALGLG